MIESFPRHELFAESLGYGSQRVHRKREYHQLLTRVIFSKSLVVYVLNTLTATSRP